MSRSKRSLRISRSRTGRARIAGCRIVPYSTTSNRSSSKPRVGTAGLAALLAVRATGRATPRRRRWPPRPPPRRRRRGRRALPRSPPRSASGRAARAARPPPWSTSSTRWRRRWETCTDQVVSRRCRFSSPMIVGTANVLNATPRSWSKRSIALTSAHAGDLDQVLDRFAAAGVAACEPLGQRHETFHQPLARRFVPVVAVAAEEPLLVERAAVDPPSGRLDGSRRLGMTHDCPSIAAFPRPPARRAPMFRKRAAGMKLARIRRIGSSKLGTSLRASRALRGSDPVRIGGGTAWGPRSFAAAVACCSACSH